MPHQLDITDEMRQCIRRCLDCHSICMETVVHCLGLGGKHADPAHIRLLMDCAQICQTSADFMLRGSELHTRTCGVCAEICRQCADDCRRIGVDDETMKRCADACNICAKSCESMAGATV